MHLALALAYIFVFSLFYIASRQGEDGGRHGVGHPREFREPIIIIIVIIIIISSSSIYIYIYTHTYIHTYIYIYINTEPMGNFTSLDSGVFPRAFVWHLSAQFLRELVVSADLCNTWWSFRKGKHDSLRESPQFSPQLPENRTEQCQMHVNISLSLSLSIYLSLYIYIYIERERHTYVYVCIHIYIYIYTHIHIHILARETP